MSLRPVKRSRRKHSRRPLLNSQGNWNFNWKPDKLWTKRRFAIIFLALAISMIFAIGKYPGGPLPIVMGDYNSSFSHTRTLIFGDTQFLGPKTVGQTTFQASTLMDQCTITCSSPSLSTSSGNFLMVHTDCWSSAGTDIGTVTDTLSDSFTRVISQTFGGIDSIWKASSSGGSDSVTVSKGTCGTFSFSFEVYSGATGLGLNNQDTGSSANTSGGDTLTMTISANSLIYEAWSVSNGNANCPTLSAGSSQSLRETFTCFVAGGNRLDGSTLDKQFTTGGATPSTANWGNGGGGVTWSHMVVELLSGSASLDFSKVRWSFNSTCVSLAGPTSPEADFDYSKGTTGLGGNNCSSADIMISKSAFNLQTVSARMLEMVMAWSNVKTALKNVTMVLRSTNGTLPSFRENYNPFNDVQARLIWWACPTVTCSGGNQTVFIAHDNTKTVNQETFGNDKIIGVGNPNFKPGVQNSFQTVLNFTGPINFMSGSNQTSTSQNSASGLQMGQDYYVLIMVNMDTTQTPASCNCVIQFLGGITSGTGNPSLGIWSVPASCQDPVNRVTCGLGTPQPTFDFNPLDPSSWGNAIIKGLVWVFTVAIGLASAVIFQVVIPLVTTVMNLIGNFFGLGNVGTDFFAILNAVVTFFTSGNFGAIFTNTPVLFNRLIDALAVYFPWLPTAISVGVSYATLGINSIGFILTIIGFAFTLVSGGFVMYTIIFWFIYTGDDAFGGVLAFFETTQWMIFGLGLKFLANLVNFSLDVVTNLIGLIPKPVIQMVAHAFPRIPIVEVNARFVWPSLDLGEIRVANLFSVALWTSGFLFFDFYESANPALPGSIIALQPNTANLIRPISGLIPLLEILTIIIWGAAFLMIPINMLQPIMGDLGGVPFEAGPGRHISTGPGAFRVAKATKHFQGRLEKKIAKRTMAGIDRSKTPEEQATA